LRKNVRVYRDNTIARSLLNIIDYNMRFNIYIYVYRARNTTIAWIVYSTKLSPIHIPIIWLISW